MKSRSSHEAEVLVTGGNTRTGLAIARSLARRGVSLIIVGDRTEMALCSRYVQRSFVTPSPSEQPDAFYARVRDLIREHNIRLVIPVPDATLLVFEQHRDELLSMTRLAMAGSDSVRNVLDKKSNLQLARKLGIPCPRQYEPANAIDMEELVQQLGFPIVAKSPGRLLPDPAPRFPKVVYLNDRAQVRTYLDKYCGDGSHPVFQQCVVGKVHNLCCFAARGETIAIHEYHSIRRFEGVGVLRKIVATNPTAASHARAMLKALQWDGVAHVAFFVTDDGSLQYMETNGRFWGSVQGSIHAGWDFPSWVHRYFLHGEVPTPGAIDMHSATCWHRGDLESLIAYLRGGEIPATGTFPGKPRAIAQYLSGYKPRIHSDVFDWSDPMPSIVDHLRLGEELVRRFKKRLRRLKNKSRRK